ncbi:GNAT family N-acetyltransferase [Undibacterium sp.]|jgi:ElaA protein|uniref:GNAT family N-acetyltransferase n=1 Tax=Undibacterium sp. TaxID=1914977 RepID=UPI002D0B78AA|nr:GNAT family N-acetyltransferase [Undibacterium sp.]HTD05013.1 GNAT family N-acetyltransferase [Undibacterium sp.]
MHTNQADITWQCARLSELSAAQQYAIFSARSEVFVVEQNCAFLDMDGLDLDAVHVIGWAGSNTVAAYLRIVAPGIKFPEPSLGRVITTRPYRGGGAGRALIAEGIRQLERIYPGQAIRIGAQAYLEKFYGAFGFKTVTEIYLEDDIPHLDMVRPAGGA